MIKERTASWGIDILKGIGLAAKTVGNQITRLGRKLGSRGINDNDDGFVQRGKCLVELLLELAERQIIRYHVGQVSMDTKILNGMPQRTERKDERNRYDHGCVIKDSTKPPVGKQRFMGSEFSEHEKGKVRYGALIRQAGILPRAVALLLLFVQPLRSETGLKEPQRVVESLNAALMDAMRAGKTQGFSSRFQRLEPVITSSFMLAFMAQTSLGPYWTELEEFEKSKYFDAYQAYSIASYAGRFKSYNGEQFQIESVSEPIRGTVTIECLLLRSNSESLAFTYRLRKGTTGWKIVDIHINGVSQLALTRSQFTQVIRKEGIEGLVANLQNKREALSRAGTP